MIIYAIGHSNYPFDKLIEMMKVYDINCVADIRNIPYSRYNSQYNRENFIKELKKIGIAYVYLGDELGAKRLDKKSYTDEGYADFSLVVKERSFVRGIERLKNGCAKGYRIAILGAVQDPVRCPRAILIGRELVKEGIDVRYIMHEGGLQNQHDIEQSLLDKYFSKGYQLTMESVSKAQTDRKAMIDDGYKLANREIGYRIEHIKERI